MDIKDQDMSRQTREPLEPAPPQGIRSALVASANPAHARVDRASLRRARILKAVTFHSGDKALKHLLSEPVDVVLCDSELSDMTGLDFIRQARAEERLARQPVLVMSLDNRERAVLNAIAAGCAGYLLRPYSLDSFLYQLKNVRQGMDFEAAAKAMLE
ncbi:MAG: response regulator, partial [Thermodesulfobacteriota bacterium]|nr:response regulator [Thermodesulfobacteriota bacterium]